MITKIAFSRSAKAWSAVTHSFPYKPPISPAALALEETHESSTPLVAPILFGDGGSPRIEAVQWGWIDKASKKNVYHMAADGRSIGRRCLIVASHFETLIEGQPDHRARFERTDGNLLCLAGMWRPASTLGPRAFTILVCRAGEDVAGFNAYQPVGVKPTYLKDFVDQTKDVFQLMRADKMGTLKAEVVPYEPSVGDCQLTNDSVAADPRYFQYGGKTNFSEPKLLG
jgi:hypothetical protein